MPGVWGVCPDLQHRINEAGETSKSRDGHCVEQCVSVSMFFAEVPDVVVALF